MNSALFVILNGVKNPVRAHRSILLTNNWILRSAQNDNLGKFISAYLATPPGCSPSQNDSGYGFAPVN